MAMNSAQFKDVVEPILNTIFDGLYDELPSEWDKIFDVQGAKKRAFEEHTVLFGLGQAVEKDQGAPITYDAGGESYRVPFNHITYALAFELTEELLEDGEHISIGSLYSRQLARSMKETKEIVHANILSRATNGSYPLGDGQPLLSTAHPYAAGGTWSNTLSTAADLSEAALEQSLIQIRTVKDQRGATQANVQPMQLVIAPANEFEAERILNSTLRVGTANNDINAMKAMGKLSRVQLVTRMTTTRGWFIQTNAEQGAIHKRRAPLRTAMEGDFDSGNMRYKARERYSANIVDPRAFFGSVPA